MLRETDISTLLDGGNNVGMLAMYHATEWRSTRRRIAASRSRRHQQLDERAQRLLCRDDRQADLVGIHTAASARSVAPFGGSRATLGTNPIAFGMPSSRGPIVFDMGTSAFMGTDLAYRERLGQLLPEGVAVDPEGNPRAIPLPRGSGRCFRLAGIKALVWL